MTTTQPGFWARLTAKTHEVESNQFRDKMTPRQEDMAARRLSMSLAFAVVVIILFIAVLLLVLLLA